MLSPPATTACGWCCLKQLQFFQGEFSRVISRSKIGNVVISGSPGMPLASGVMKNTQTTAVVSVRFLRRKRGELVHG